MTKKCGYGLVSEPTDATPVTRWMAMPDTDPSRVLHVYAPTAASALELLAHYDPDSTWEIRPSGHLLDGHLVEPDARDIPLRSEGRDVS